MLITIQLNKIKMNKQAIFKSSPFKSSAVLNYTKISQSVCSGAYFQLFGRVGFCATSFKNRSVRDKCHRTHFLRSASHPFIFWFEFEACVSVSSLLSTQTPAEHLFTQCAYLQLLSTEIVFMLSKYKAFTTDCIVLHNSFFQ